MKFRVTNKKVFSNENVNSEKFDFLYSNDFYTVGVNGGEIVASDNDKKIICIGSYSSIVVTEIKRKDEAVIFENLLLDFNAKIVQAELQGKFILIYLSINEIKIVMDAFSRADIYYTEEKGIVEIASDLSLLSINKEKTGYNQNALAHMLTYYGNRPAKKETIYNSVKRLGVQESIKINNNDFKIERETFKPISTREYTVDDNEQYYKLFLQALADGGSDKGNIVYLSSGWDSTAILAGLVKVFGSSKVRAITGRMKYSDRSGVCNLIEIEKAQKFADYYGTKLDIVDFDYADNAHELVSLALPIMKKHGFYNITGVNHAILAKAAKKIVGDTEQVIFAGELSDGAHNFGFSQYATFFHPSYDFREYADKMASYLFGPTFLNRIVNGDYKTDPIYKLFYADANFKIDDASKDEKKIKENFFIDFYLRNGRKPFWSNKNIGILSSQGVKKYTEFHYEQYLSICEDVKLETLYSYYLYLYNSFHWQGSTVATLDIMASEYGLKTCLPFWDKGIQDFLSEMPENWGRGLDLNNTKYPLKWMLKNKFDYPLELQEGPHSYAYDVDHSFNHYEELLCHSSFSIDVKKILRQFDFNEILSSEVFEVSYIKELINNYLNTNKLSGIQLNEIFSLYFLAKIEIKRIL